MSEEKNRTLPLSVASLIEAAACDVDSGGARRKILDLAERAVLEKGFGATSIDELIAGAGISKSGFFYHFKDKTELAKALLIRYLDRDETIFDEIERRSVELSEDPLHSFLISLKLLAELLAEMPTLHPGCLVASYCYQERLFDQEVRLLNKQGVLRWRTRFRSRIRRIADAYPPRTDVDLDALADMIPALLDGGIIISKVLDDKEVLPQQVLLYREFVRNIFLG